MDVDFKFGEAFWNFIIQLKELAAKTGFIYYHGTTQGIISSLNQPSNIDYAHRPPPPKSWEEKIKFCSNNLPSLSAGRIIPGDTNNIENIWSPVGLLIEDGAIVGTSGHITGPEGKLMRVDGGDPYPYDPSITPDDFKKSPYSRYEIGVEKPSFLGIYICPQRIETTGHEEYYENLQERATKLGKECNLPVYLVDDKGIINKISDK